jgi:hypothetical protein
MTAKAIALANDLASSLKQRQALAVAVSFDTDNLPLVKVGTGVAGAAGALIKLVPQDWALAKDILGLTANVYAPTKAQVLFESNPSAGAGADLMTWAQLLPIIGEVLARGCRTEVYTVANGVAPVAAGIIAGNLRATFDPSVQYGMIANQ